METGNLLKSLHLSLLNVDDCCTENWNFQKVTSPFTRLYYIKGGQGNILHNHQKFELKPGRLYLIPSYTICSYSSKSYLDHIYIHSIPQVLGGANIYKLIDFKCEVEASETHYELMKRILELNPGRKLVNIDPEKYCKDDLFPHERPNPSAHELACIMETQGILLQLFSYLIESGGRNRLQLLPDSNLRISQAIDYIQMNLTKSIKISELAKSVSLSNDYFSRLFLKTTGMRPIDYINHKRIENAQLQLITTNDPVEKIALDVGVDNFSYFNRLFQKYSHSTPGEYRKLHRLV